MNRGCIIWDFGSNSHGIGDMCDLLLGVHLISLEYDVDKVDIFIICNPSKPNRGTFEESIINPGNYMLLLPHYISLIYTNPLVGNVSIYDSYESLYSIDESNYKVIYPTIDEVISYHETNVDIMDRVYSYHSMTSNSPVLDIVPSLKSWAHRLFDKYEPRYPIVLGLRNSNRYSSSRNADISIWLDLFRKMIDNPVVFIIVSSYDEISDELSREPNIIYSKTYHTSIAHDMALVKCGLMFTGTASGLASVAIHGNVPHLIYRWTGEHINRNKEQCEYLTCNHHLLSRSERRKTIYDDFNNIYNTLDKDLWLDEHKMWVKYDGYSSQSASSFVGGNFE